MPGLFITFEGTEGSGKSTQISLLGERLKNFHPLRVLREPGGTPLGEEIRHILKHSAAGDQMTPEAELLLMNASRSQLVRQTIRPALEEGCIVLCDRFYDSTIAYQGYGRGLDLDLVRTVIELAVGTTKPDITFLLEVPLEVSETRRRLRNSNPPMEIHRDRFEEADREFFLRVERGFAAIAANEPARFAVVPGTASVEAVQQHIWRCVEPRLAALGKS